MNNPIEKSFHELVELKFQLYNSLFLTLPLDAVEQTGLLIPLLQESCQKGFEQGLSPDQIIHTFFAEHKPEFEEPDRIAFLFKIIQYVERQIVLIDALEEAAYAKIHHVGNADAWDRLKSKVNEQNLQESLLRILDNFGIRVVLTAHPTQFYPGRVLAISTDLTQAVESGNIAYTRELLQQLGKTPFYRKQKPTVLDEATSLIWYVSSIFYPAIGHILDRICSQFQVHLNTENRLITLGFWPGGDRDGNPFVTTDTTLKVALELRQALLSNYLSDVKKLKRRLSFTGIYEQLIALEQKLQSEVYNAGVPVLKADDLLQEIVAMEHEVNTKHQGLFVEQVSSFKRKIMAFGYAFASIDIRQDSRVIHKAFNALVAQIPEILPYNFNDLSLLEQLNYLFGIHTKITLPKFDDALINDTLNAFRTIAGIQQLSGEMGAHRFIISNCRGAIDVARVYALARLCHWANKPMLLDVVPLFETIDDLKNAGTSMELLYQCESYKNHVAFRRKRQTVMLGFSDGTKDGGYLMANWSIFKAKEAISLTSRKYGLEVMFFDGRGGPPARGGGNAHMFYAALGKNIESKQIQMTVQGQTISSHYGNLDAAMHNLTHLLSAGIENNLFDNVSSELNMEQRQLIEALAQLSFKKYEALKNHELFLPFLEERSTLKYYGLANIGSRPSKRGSSNTLKFDDLRAIPFVGAWSQLKQNVPGFYGVGSALKAQEEQGNLEACITLYKQSTFFKTLISNSMQSMSKTNFELTRYMQNDPKFGDFWTLIYNEFQLSKSMVLKISGLTGLLDDNPRSRMSIQMRERVVLPLLAVQQYALIAIQRAKESGNKEFLNDYDNMVMRSLFGNINASRNSV